ncbi:helix-turn-helix domain-containing protein [Micromonospora sp. NPDC007230]|uniref:helix-turn-helix domain-containing protein n=1 Tax=Micromonospora sp. NPDC007230 TaxID=3364237 RepID=UPI00367C1970
MREHLGEQLTVDDMARAAMFSKFHFTRIFRHTTGVSPGRFLSALRLQRAKHLLVSTSWNVADISMYVGYNSVGTFSSRFTRSVGMSPTTYRKRSGFARRIPTDPRFAVGHTSTAKVYGRISLGAGQAPGPVFAGLFPNRVPEGQPVRCAILAGPGAYQFDAVPPGTWYLLAQSVSDDLDEPAPHDPERLVSVASHGPLTVHKDRVIRTDLRLQPARALDPPVLLALLDARELALGRTAARAETDHLPSIMPATAQVPPLRASDRSAA